MANSPFTLEIPSTSDQTWRLNAACTKEDPELFFPETGETAQAQKAIAVCKTCPVISQCRSWALETDQRDGVLGGMTPHQRARHGKPRRRTKVAAAA